MKKANKLAAVVFVLAVAVLYVIIYAVPNVTGALTRTEILQYGNLKVMDDVTCYFVRTEKVYSAAHSGVINYYFGDGIQVKTGTRILELTSSTPETGVESQYKDIITRLGNDGAQLYNCISEFNGLTSYYIDGYENYFTPETMRSLRYEEVSQLDPVPVNVTRESTLKDEPLYKICDNGLWYIICWVDTGNVPKYKVDSNVAVNLPLGPIKATVTDIVENGDKWLIILKTNRYYEDFTKIRKVEATIVTSDYNGIIIPNESITTSDGAIGVYVKSKSGEFRFDPVKIITTDGKHSLVEVSYYYDDAGNKVDTVDIYDELLKKPN